MKRKSLIGICLVLLIGAAWFAAGFWGDKLTDDKGQDSIKNIQEQLKDSITFKAEEKMIL